MKRGLILSAVILLAAASLAQPRPAGAADPFYTRLLERGVRELELGSAESARAKLRTACFGLLEEPALLAEALMQLGRAQAMTGRTADLVETAERLVELEDRFGAYSELEGALKASFEDSLRSSIAPRRLQRMPLFEHLAAAPRPASGSVESMTPRQRRRELERRLEANPGDDVARLELARLHYETGKLKSSGALLDRLLASAPENEEALCLRADIARKTEQCAPALAGIDRCSSPVLGESEAAFLVECLHSAGRDAEALALLGKFAPELRRARAVDRAARKIDPAAEVLEESAAVDEPTEAGDAATEAGDAAPEADADPALSERLLALRAQIARSRFREELTEALVGAEQLVVDFPDSSEAQYLAAEIAYLCAEWRLALDYFERAGEPPAERPELLFYMAVSTYETGDAEEAARILRLALPTLSRKPFVDAYVEKILGAPAS